MTDVRLKPVTFAELSGLRHEIAISDDPQRRTPEILVIRYFGSYRDGAAGCSDALYILAAAAAAREAWWSRSTVLDFRELEYRWGDNMQWITRIGWDPRTGLQWPLAIVVGDKCQRALRSLLRGEFQGLCVESLDEAFTMCRQKAREHEQRLREIRSQAEPHAGADGGA